MEYTNFQDGLTTIATVDFLKLKEKSKDHTQILEELINYCDLQLLALPKLVASAKENAQPYYEQYYNGYNDALVTVQEKLKSKLLKVE